MRHVILSWYMFNIHIYVYTGSRLYVFASRTYCTNNNERGAFCRVLPKRLTTGRQVSAELSMPLPNGCIYRNERKSRAYIPDRRADETINRYFRIM